MQNLLSNAVKFVTPGIQPVVNISAKETKKEFQIKITDNGIGINKEHQQSIYKIFERLHSREEYPGTGIGLSIAMKATKLHGGKLWFESEVGTGTSFYFSISKNVEYFHELM